MTAPLLAAIELRKRFGGVPASDGVSLTVSPGEIHALIGPNGAGKTTLIAQLAGALRPDSGRIELAGRDITALGPSGRVRLGLARSYQVTTLFGALGVLDNLALAVQARSGSSMSFWRPAAREKALYEQAAAIVARIGLAGRESVAAAHLAHGEQRTLEVGLALATRPRLLLLDEPMAGMGPEESARMLALIQQLREAEPALSVLLIEHDLDAVFRLADRISVLVSGRVLATGTPAEIRADAQVRKAYLGEESA
ncbi:MAG TPA: ABC transporter ATP-binding protein [Burkholderiales bacterium]